MFRLFLINSYQSGILLKIKRKLELNMYLDVRFYLKCLHFLSVRKLPPEMLCGSKCSWGFCRITFWKSCWSLACSFVEGEALVWVFILVGFAKFLGASSVCFICDILQIYIFKEKYITRYNLVYNLYIVLCFLCFILELVL